MYLPLCLTRTAKLDECEIRSNYTNIFNNFLAMLIEQYGTT